MERTVNIKYDVGDLVGIVGVVSRVIIDKPQGVVKYDVTLGNDVNGFRYIGAVVENDLVSLAVKEDEG